MTSKEKEYFERKEAFLISNKLYSRFYNGLNNARNDEERNQALSLINRLDKCKTAQEMCDAFGIDRDYAYDVLDLYDDDFYYEKFYSGTQQREGQKVTVE